MENQSNNTFLDLEAEVNKRAAEQFDVVITRMLDMYDERIRQITLMNNRGNGELESLRRMYVSIKLELRRLHNRCWYVSKDDNLNIRISDLEVRTKQARRKFYEFKRSIDPHTRECECRGCKCLREERTVSKRSAG